MSGSTSVSIGARQTTLRLIAGARAADLTRAENVLATPVPGQMSALTDPMSATVQNPLGEPAQLNGMKASERLGPFVDQDGLHRTVILLPVTKSEVLAFGSATTPFGVLPIFNPPASGTSFTLGAGSVWFETTLLVPGVASGSFSGFLISGGTLSASAPVTLQSGIYVAPAGATLTLTATLAPPAPGAGAPGADLTTATIGLPETVTIRFTQTAATIEALADANVTLYGETVKLSWNKAAPSALTGLPAILIPFTPSVTSFAFQTVASAIFKPSATAPINAAGWSLPVATTTITALGEANGAGSLVLELGAGASLVCDGRIGKATIGGWLIGVDPTQLIVIVGGTGGANSTRYSLWPATPPATVASTISWTNPAGFLVSLRQVPGQETLSLGGSAQGFFDRPLAADGGALPLAGNGTLFLTITATSTTLAILAGPSTPPTDTFSLALENALVGVHAPRLLFAEGPLAHATATQFDSAAVSILFDALWLLPTLPDPYAASFNAGALINSDPIGKFAAVLSWAGAAKDVGLTVALTPATSAAGPVPSASSVPPEALTLLDLSTNADLFGVRLLGARQAVDVAAASETGFIGLSLAISDTSVLAFALPALSWEPMVDATTSPAGAILPVPATDGVPTVVRAASVAEANVQTLVPVAPVPVLLRAVSNVAAGASFTAEFSLPFGMIATINQPNRPGETQNPPLFLQDGGAFSLIQPNFKAGSGALQLMLKPPHPTISSAKFDGSTTLSTDGAAPGYGSAVLGSDIATIFTGEFSNNGGVPVLRADLAGYGASIWSEWVDPSAKGTTIIKVHFETVVGRTAYEVVKAQTTLYPYCVRLVRTVTIARQNAGWVQRTDTGWVAATPGRFEFPNTAAFPQTLVNRGAIAGVFNVRNIREFETVPAGGFTYRRALFDADVGIDHRVKVTAGGAASSFTDVDGKSVTLVPARDLTGYVQIAPDESGSPPSPNPDPGPADLVLLFDKVAALADGFACVAEIGGTATAAGTALRVAGLSFAMTPGSAPALAVALLSSPVLPRDGAWGFGKRPAGATAPSALPANAPVPLVQPKSAPSTWHFADPSDVLQLASPANVYGLLQDTGTQRTLFEQPTVPDLSGVVPPGTVPSIQLPAGVAPALADIGSMLGATGLFPDLAKTISFLTGAIEQLKTIPQGLHYTKEIDFTGNEEPTTLLDLGVLKIDLIYADTSRGRTGSTWNQPTKVSFNIDPAHTLPDSNGRNWWLTIGQISFAVTIPEFGSDPLLTIIGGFAADDRSKPGLTGLNIDYGAALATLKSLFSKLQALASFLPGGLGAGLDVSLSDGKLTVRDTFALPTLPLGLGNLSDISLDLGLTVTLSPLSADFLIGVGDPGNPFNWVVSPLAGNGAIDVGVKGGAPDFSIQGGIGLGLSIDIGIAEGSASITLAFSLEVNGSAITVMIILNGQASVDVLGGLASASLSLTAAIGVRIDPLPIPQITTSPPGIAFPAETITFLASVAVGIHISICWVISVDFEGSWQFSQSIHTPQISVDV